MTRSVLKSLLKPDAYPEPTGRVEMVQTHVSWIFLTDSHAYKIKKPVDFGFLNFSTIDRRRFYCNEEVKYNRRLCPDIYEGVVELRVSGDGAAFSGDGQVIDYAVKMKRLPAERMLDQLVMKNEVSADQIRKVAEVIADFHRRAPTSATISSHGTLERIRYNWNENFDQSIPFEPLTLPHGDREYVRNWVVQFMEENVPLFDERVTGGFIRECDGDIHLENICLQDDAIHIFDCIEFNDRFRCCDTAADIAFLLMDLDFHDRRDLSLAALEAYLHAFGDDGTLRLVDFYKTYRAFVRGKVESFRLLDPSVGESERKLISEKAKRYFHLARGYVQRRLLGPALFITCGLMGSGKSTIAHLLARDLGLARFSSDETRKRLAGISPEKHVMVPFGEDIYSPDSTTRTYGKLLRLAEAELAAGGSVILDASFSRVKERALCRLAALRHNARFIILQIVCGEEELRRRLGERSAGAVTLSDGRLELLFQQQQQFEPPNDQEGTLILLNAAETPERLTDKVHERLG